MDGHQVANVSTDDETARVQLSDGKILRASLVVAADTRFSASRRQMGISADSHNFGRTAIVCKMEHELSHDNTAFECFHYGRTLAICRCLVNHRLLSLLCLLQKPIKFWQ